MPHHAPPSTTFSSRSERLARWRYGIVAVTLGWCLAAGAAAGQGDRLAIRAVTVGIDGVCKLGYWAPVMIEVAGGSDAPLIADLETLDGDGVSVRYLGGTPIRPRPGRQVVGMVKLGRPGAAVTVLLKEASTGRVVARRRVVPAPQPSTVTWVLQIGAPIGIERIEPYGARSALRRVVTQHLDADQVGRLPETWTGYDGVDVIFLPTSRSAALGRLTEAQRRALVRWVREGGRVIVSVGDKGASAYGDGLLPPEWSPGTITSVESRFETTGLLHYTKAEQVLPKRIGTRFAVVESPRGPTLAHEGAGGLGDRPLVIEHAVGFGRVTTLMIDLDRAPIATWLGLPRLMATLAGIYHDESLGRHVAAGSQLARVGYSDLVGQLRAALDQFESVTLVRFSWVAAILVLYILLIGPADYFGLAWLRRPHWTWFTFTLAVAGFAAPRVTLSYGVKGHTVRRNQLEIVDVDIDTGRYRGTLWSHVYSPRLEQWNVTLATDAGGILRQRADEVRLSWQGLPGTRIGALRGPTGVVVRSMPYELRADLLAGEARGWPVLVSSTRSFLGQWYGEAPSSWTDSADLSATKQGLLRGELRNPLPVPLTQCAIVYGNWVYRLPGGLRPGERVRIAELRPLDFRWQLTRRRVVEGHDVSVPWDVEATGDLARIAEMLMFHDAAGGPSYTRLDHIYQSWVDLSRHLDLRRAMLVGRAATSAAQIEISQHPDPPTDRRLTMVRIMWPVAPADEERHD